MQVETREVLGKGVRLVAALTTGALGAFGGSARPSSAEALEAVNHRPAIARSIEALSLTRAEIAAPVEASQFTVERATFTAIGIPESAVNVLRADHAPFRNGVFGGTEAFLAEPGVLLAGPDLPASVVNAAGGSIEYISPVNQQVFTGWEERTSGSFNVPEGGFVVGSFQDGMVWVGGNGDAWFDLIFPQIEPNNNILVVRGLFNGDGDRNRRMQIGDVISGHNVMMRYPRGAFVSQNHFMQVVETSLRGGTNCGSSGCETTTVSYLDVNTGAFGHWLVRRDQPWEVVFTNY